MQALRKLLDEQSESENQLLDKQDNSSEIVDQKQIFQNDGRMKEAVVLDNVQDCNSLEASAEMDKWKHEREEVNDDELEISNSKFANERIYIDDKDSILIDIEQNANTLEVRDHYIGKINRIKNENEKNQQESESNASNLVMDSTEEREVYARAEIRIESCNRTEGGNQIVYEKNGLKIAFKSNSLRAEKKNCSDKNNDVAGEKCDSIEDQIANIKPEDETHGIKAKKHRSIAVLFGATHCKAYRG